MLMMTLSVYILFLYLIESCLSLSTIQKLSPNGFGPYEVHTKSVEMCPPTKKRSSNYCDCNIYVNKVKRNMEEFKGYCIIRNDIGNGGAAASLFLVRDGLRVPVLSVQTANPCKEAIFAKLMKGYLVTNNDCVTKKGNYTVDTINANELFHTMAGNNFIYEKFHFSMEWFERRKSTCCLSVVIETRPISRAKGRKPQLN